ncbi:hypothetical protein [Nonomuraea indica]|uniref:hypothetical protein n=1 Tax=Nonomuraea indica TaxID=1581193 RepID=UPI000C7DB218|nr:hypothetical protein [Nonomuraea indica]
MRLLTATGADALFDLDAATATRRAAVATPATGDAGQPDRIGGGPDGARSTVLCPAAAVVVDTCRPPMPEPLRTGQEVAW